MLNPGKTFWRSSTVRTPRCSSCSPLITETEPSILFNACWRLDAVTVIVSRTIPWLSCAKAAVQLTAEQQTELAQIIVLTLRILIHRSRQFKT
jgi:hypothetical protein